jgi:hypothetical protein
MHSDFQRLDSMSDVIMVWRWWHATHVKVCAWMGRFSGEGPTCLLPKTDNGDTLTPHPLLEALS